jgi:hypothetical protein
MVYILYAVNAKALHFDNNPVGAPMSVPKSNPQPSAGN